MYEQLKNKEKSARKCVTNKFSQPWNIKIWRTQQKWMRVKKKHNGLLHQQSCKKQRIITQNDKSVKWIRQGGLNKWKFVFVVCPQINTYSSLAILRRGREICNTLDFKKKIAPWCESLSISWYKRKISTICVSEFNSGESLYVVALFSLSLQKKSKSSGS